MRPDNLNNSILNRHLLACRLQLQAVNKKYVISISFNNRKHDPLLETILIITPVFRIKTEGESLLRTVYICTVRQYSDPIIGLYREENAIG